jgi:hypothetical protein
MGLVPSTIAFIAKLALAEALHVRTPYFFFNGLAALGALTSVITDPVGVGLLGVDECVPTLDIVACHGIVGLALAAIAVKLTAGACHRAEFHHVGLDAEIGALLVWAIADVLILHGVAHACLFSI